MPSEEPPNDDLVRSPSDRKRLRLEVGISTHLATGTVLRETRYRSF